MVVERLELSCKGVYTGCASLRLSYDSASHPVSEDILTTHLVTVVWMLDASTAQQYAACACLGGASCDCFRRRCVASPMASYMLDLHVPPGCGSIPRQAEGAGTILRATRPIAVSLTQTSNLDSLDMAFALGGV